MVPANTDTIRTHLLAWFAAHARDLPWRRTRDPYRILVSEIMLQQTQVDRVIPKYEAFLAAFPTLEVLAEAPTAEVIRLWAGLGYNRRAINLQRTAQAVIAEHDGQFPRTPAELLTLPGIGPYTAGAVACFAFEQDVAFMDTNIRRAIRRLLIGPDEMAEASERELLALAEELVPPGAGWAWNQAIMELGALICTAAAPACWRCPLRTDCKAYNMRLQADEQLFVGGEPAYLPPPRQLRKVAERREEPYAGSRRFYRGRIVEALRALSAGETVNLARLGPLVKSDYSAVDEDWLRELVAGLARDGLAFIDDNGVRLP
jgi:A/G-specific adenine glycosylase